VGGGGTGAGSEQPDGSEAGAGEYGREHHCNSLDGASNRWVQRYESPGQGLADDMQHVDHSGATAPDSNRLPVLGKDKRRRR
jgi:hypothetical protein